MINEDNLILFSKVEQRLAAVVNGRTDGKLILVRASTTTSFVSDFIRFMSRSNYSHTAIMVSNTDSICYTFEANPDTGVTGAAFSLSSIKQLPIYIIDNLLDPSKSYSYWATYVTNDQFSKMLAFLVDQVGKLYDWGGVVRVLHYRRNWRSNLSDFVQN